MVSSAWSRPPRNAADQSADRVFEPHTVLLADGNIGIGGDPHALPARVEGEARTPLYRPAQNCQRHRRAMSSSRLVTPVLR
jgi:hypothetical protein